MVESSEEKRTNREISNANLILIEKGQVLNPGGRPKGTSLTAVLRELLDQIPRGDNKKLKEKIVKALLDKALTGDTRALDIIFDRTDGKVSLPLEVTEIQKIEFVPAKERDAAQQEEKQGQNEEIQVAR